MEKQPESRRLLCAPSPPVLSFNSQRYIVVKETATACRAAGHKAKGSVRQPRARHWPTSSSSALHIPKAHLSPPLQRHRNSQCTPPAGTYAPQAHADFCKCSPAQVPANPGARLSEPMAELLPIGDRPQRAWGQARVSAVRTQEVEGAVTETCHRKAAGGRFWNRAAWRQGPGGVTARGQGQQ